MIRSAVTISLVKQAQGGPFVFWDDLAESCRKAAALGFDAVEIFASAPDAVDPARLKTLLETYQLQLAAVGTGAGMVLHQLSLTAADAAQRAQAIAFIRGMIDFGASYGAPAIIGSMQGRFGGGIDRPTALGWLAESLNELGGYAQSRNVPLIYEPLNRYETNLVCTVAAGVELLNSLSTNNVRLLADLFHMNVEEADLPSAIRAGKGVIGHVHFVDSNRRPAGCGHLDYPPIVEALEDIGYHGYASAEALPLPTPEEAARLTMTAFQQYFRGKHP